MKLMNFYILSETILYPNSKAVEAKSVVAVHTESYNLISSYRAVIPAPPPPPPPPTHTPTHTLHGMALKTRCELLNIFYSCFFAELFDDETVHSYIF